MPLLCLFVAAILSLSGCATTPDHRANVGISDSEQLTLGSVQREIHVGMSQADVASALGSPNIVTRDKTGKETWIYDKIASEVSYSTSDSYGTILILGGSASSGAVSSSQRTLTVVIRFDDESQVESFTYHSSRF